MPLPPSLVLPSAAADGGGSGIGPPPNDAGTAPAARVAALAPLIREHAPTGRRDHRLPSPPIEALREAGLYRLLQPRRWGGAEAAPGAFFDTQIAIAEHDMSTGWLHGVMGVLAFHVALFDDRAQAEVWGENRDAILASSNMPRGRAVPCGDGFTISGRWGFASGIDHCDWVILGGVVERPEDAAGPPDVRAFLLPRNAVRVAKPWRSAGLEGTGSHDVVVEGAFVPAWRTHSNADRFAGRNPGCAVNTGPLYRIPLPQLLLRAISSAAIGALAGMVADVTENLRPRVSVTGAKAAEDPVGQLAIGEALAAVDEMRVVLHADMDRLMAAAEQGLDPGLAARRIHRQHAVTVPERCARLAWRLFKATGASGLSADLPFAARLADIQAARQHVANQYEIYGRLLGASALGLEPADMLL